MTDLRVDYDNHDKYTSGQSPGRPAMPVHAATTDNKILMEVKAMLVILGLFVGHIVYFYIYLSVSLKACIKVIQILGVSNIFSLWPRLCINHELEI